MNIQRRAARHRIGFVLGAVLLLVLVAIGVWKLRGSRKFQLFGGLVTEVATADSVVALTLDDGPVEAWSDSVLDYLDSAKVRVTFFTVGSAIAREPAAAARMVRAGHELGNHSYSHRRMLFMSQQTIRHEVLPTDSLIRAAGYRGAIHFRPPFGTRLVGLPWYLSRTGRKTILWTLEPDTWYATSDEMVEHVMRNVKPGSIILLHVEIPLRVEGRRALPRIVEGLRARGYRFVTVSELLTRTPSK